MRDRKISILLPFYNSEDTIEESIISVINQTYSDYEFILSDNASTDNSYEIIEKYLNSDRRIKYIKNEINVGAKKNYENLARLANCDYVIFISDDDFWDREYLQTLVSCSLNNPEYLAYFTKFQFVDEEGKKIKKTIELNYESEFSIIRLIKFTFNMQDIWFYGLFKKEAIIKLQFPNWWGPNNKSIYNIAYPVCYHILASGNYKYVSSELPLFFKRQRTKSLKRHLIPFFNDRAKPNYFMAFFVYLLKEFNLLYVIVKYIYHGPKSLFLLIVLFPFLILFSLKRIFYDSTKAFIKNHKNNYKHKADI